MEQKITYPDEYNIHQHLEFSGEHHSLEEEEMTKRRRLVDAFVSNLSKAGIRPTTSIDKARFHEIIDLIFSRMHNEATHCLSAAGALNLYNMAETFVTPTTAEKYKMEDIILEEPLSNAHSHKAFLLRVFVAGVPKVLKYPKCDDNDYFVKSVQKDIQFCDLCRSKEDGRCMSGIVEYCPFGYVTVDGVSVSGSISKIYTCSLADIHGLFPPSRVLSICRHVLATITRIHLEGLSVNDIKLSNLYMDMTGEIDIADFGGYCEMGDVISEYTADVMPVEYAREGVAWPKVDRICLVSCGLRLLGLHYSGKPTVAKYRSLVEESVSHEELKEFLLSLFPNSI